MSVFHLPRNLQIPGSLHQRLERDYHLSAPDEMPSAGEGHGLGEYDLEVAGEFCGLPLRNPFGRAGGPFSRNLHQVRDDAEAGLGFVTLTPVAACDKEGASLIQDWAALKSNPSLDEIDGGKDHTLTWLHCGWYENFETWLKFLRSCLEIGARQRIPIIPSVHFPVRPDGEGDPEVFRFTVRSLQEVWHGIHPDLPLRFEMIVADGHKGTRSSMLRQLSSASRLVRRSATRPQNLRIGLKIPNAKFQDEFQVEMLQSVGSETAQPDFLVLFGRFLEQRRNQIVSSGGPSLCDRNLRTLDAWINQTPTRPSIPFTALGHITSGRTMVEYALRGAGSGQIHTLLQLPDACYRMKDGHRTRRALHELAFHPQDGLVAAMLHLREVSGVRRFLDIPSLWGKL